MLFRSTAFPKPFKNNYLGEFIGNPVRTEIAGMADPATRYAARGAAPLKVLAIGGSQGAAALNETVPKALALLPPQARPQVTHQAGAAHIDALRANYEKAGVQAELVAYIDNMAQRYAEVDLVIARAGASTVTEIAAAGVAALFVPFPHAVDDHQTTNARYLVDRGAAFLLPQPEFTPEKLAGLLREFTRGGLTGMAVAARAAAKPDATRDVAHICMELAHAA